MCRVSNFSWNEACRPVCSMSTYSWMRLLTCTVVLCQRAVHGGSGCSLQEFQACGWTWGPAELLYSCAWGIVAECRHHQLQGTSLTVRGGRTMCCCTRGSLSNRFSMVEDTPSMRWGRPNVSGSSSDWGMRWYSTWSARAM